MPLYISDEIAPYIKLRILGTLLSAIAYGIVIVLAGNCFQLLQKKQGIYSNRRQIPLLLYVTFMLLISTWALIQSIWQFMDFITLRNILPSYLTYLSIAIPPAIWGADGFMVWRCVVLYQDMSKGPRIVIFVLLALISFASFGCGVIVLVENGLLVHALLYAYPAFIALSTLVNIVLAVLVVSRIVYYRRHVRNALGVEHGSLYTNVITICIESSALMVVSSGLYTALDFGLPNRFGSPNWGGLMSTLLPHICVISPLLIVYRVAMGRAMPQTSLPGQIA